MWQISKQIKWCGSPASEPCRSLMYCRVLFSKDKRWLRRPDWPEWFFRHSSENGVRTDKRVHALTLAPFSDISPKECRNSSCSGGQKIIWRSSLLLLLLLVSSGALQSVRLQESLAYLSEAGYICFLFTAVGWGKSSYSSYMEALRGGTCFSSYVYVAHLSCLFYRSCFHVRLMFVPSVCWSVYFSSSSLSVSLNSPLLLSSLFIPLFSSSFSSFNCLSPPAYQQPSHVPFLTFLRQNEEKRSLNLGGHVGFDSLPDQLVSKSVTQGFCFNILCVGK